MRYNLQSHKQHRGGGTLDGVEGGHREGHAYTPHGIVLLYASGPAGSEGFTSYRFALGGRWYFYREEVARSERGAILMAHMLVKQAVKEQAEPSPTRAELLDLIEAQGDGRGWTARMSTTGRGFRLHNPGPHRTAKEALVAFGHCPERCAHV